MRTAAIFLLNGAAWFAYGLLVEAGGDYQNPNLLVDWMTIYVFS